MSYKDFKKIKNWYQEKFRNDEIERLTNINPDLIYKGYVSQSLILWDVETTFDKVNFKIIPITVQFCKIS
jgi:hypothetical protein